MQRTSNGINGINNALAALGHTERFNKIFNDWKVATRINDDNAGENNIFSYPEKTYQLSGTRQLRSKITKSFSGTPAVFSLDEGSTPKLIGYGSISLRFSSPPDPGEVYRLKVTVPKGDPDVAVYKETSYPRSVSRVTFTGDVGVLDLNDWGTNYTSFQIMISTSQTYETTKLDVDLDILDETPPVTTSYLTPLTPDGADGWYVTLPRVKLTTESGATVYYQEDGGEERKYQTDVFIHDGTHTLTYWAVDRRGNIEEKHLLRFKVDTIVPTTTILLDPEGDADDWLTQTPKIYLDTSHTDALIFYGWDTEPVEEYTTFLTPPEGEHLLYWRSIDMAGNEEAVNDRRFKLDTQRPVVEYSIAPETPDGLNGWYTAVPEVTLTTEKGLVIHYALDDNEILQYTGPILVPEGVHRVFARTEDQAGNTAENVLLDFKVDLTAPEISWEFNGFSYNPDNSSSWLPIFSPTLTLISNEDRTEIKYSINGEEALDYLSPITLQEGVNVITVEGTDLAGIKAEPLELEVRLDSRSPLAIHRIVSERTEGWYTDPTASVELEVIGEDNRSSPVRIYYRWGSEAEREYRNPIQIRDGQNKLYYRAVDEAGNMMDTITLDLRKDSETPLLIEVIDGLVKGEIIVGENITFDLTASQDDIEIKDYMVDFGDGTVETWTQTGRFVYSFKKAGHYNVTLWVRDTAGNTANRTLQIIVKEGGMDNVNVEGSGDSSSTLLIIGIAAVLLLLTIGAIEGIILIKRRNSGKHHPTPPQPPATNGLPGKTANGLPGKSDAAQLVNGGGRTPLPPHLNGRGKELEGSRA